MNQLLYHMVLENFNTYEHRSPMGAVPTKLQESALERFLAARPYVLSQSAATKIIDTLAHEPFVWPPYFLPLPFNTVWIEALGALKQR